MILVAFLDVRGEQRDVQNKPVQQVRREVERPDKINKKNDARLVGPVPCLVVMRIVEDERAALLPVTNLVTEADGDLIPWLGNNQPEMETKDAVVKAAVGLQMLAGLKNGKHRGFEARD